MTDWLQLAEAERTPLIDTETVTFVWPGETAPLLLGDFNDWDPEGAEPMKKVASGVWIHILTTTPRRLHRICLYAYVTDLAQAQSDAGRARDPFNPRTKWNGINATNNIFYMPDAAPTPLIRRAPDVAASLSSTDRPLTL